MRRRLGMWLAVLASGAAAGRAEAACVAPQPMRPAVVADFISDPLSLLRRHPNAGLPLAYEVQSLALTSREGLESVFVASRRASFEQSEAIGVGLKKASSYCASRDPDLVRRIRDGVRSQTNRRLEIGYTFDERMAPGPRIEGADISGGDPVASGKSAGGPTASGLAGAGIKAGDRDAGSSGPPRLSPSQPLDGSDLQLSNPDRQYDSFKVD